MRHQIMSITLTPELEAFVQERARSGNYGSTDEVVQEAVRRMMAEDRSHEEAVLEGLRSQIAPLTSTELADIRRRVTRERGAV